MNTDILFIAVLFGFSWLTVMLYNAIKSVKANALRIKVEQIVELTLAASVTGYLLFLLLTY